MGRRAKLSVGDVVRIKDTDRVAVVVDYRRGAHRPYRTVETAPDGSRPRGPAIWQRASDLTPTGEQRQPPVDIYRGNKENSRADECHCRVHLADVYKAQGQFGFVERVREIAERASWDYRELGPDRLKVEPTGATPSSHESVKKGLQRAARLEGVEVSLNASPSSIWILGDFSEAVQPEPEPVQDQDPGDELESTIKRLGWRVRTRMGDKWWLIPASDSAVANAELLSVLDVGGEDRGESGVWIERQAVTS